MWGKIFPNPLDEEFLNPFAEIRSQANAAKIIFRFRNRNLLDWDSNLFFEALGPLMSGETFVDDGCDWGTELREELI